MPDTVLDRRCGLAALVLLYAAASPIAQPGPGDFLLTSSTGILRIDRTTASITTLGPLPFGSQRQVWMAANNADIRLIEQGDPSNARPMIFARMSPTGVLLSATPVPVTTASNPFIGSPTIDQDGRFIASWSVPPRSAIIRLSPFGILSTITTLPFAGAVTFDAASGHYLVLQNTTAGVGDYLVLDQSGGTVLRWQNPGAIYSFVADEETGNVMIATLNEIHETTLGGAVLRTWRFPREHSGVWRSIAIYGARKLVGSGPAFPGTTYSIQLSMPSSAQQSYLAAMSLTGLRPAIAIPSGRTVNLALDALARLTIASGDLPGITQGLRGRLDPRGRSTILVRIPRSLPRGVRVFIGAIAFSPRSPGMIDVASTCAFSVR